MEDGDIILTLPLAPEIDRYLDLKITFDVRLCDTNGVYDEEAVASVRRLIAYAEKVVTIAKRRGLL